MNTGEQVGSSAGSGKIVISASNWKFVYVVWRQQKEKGHRKMFFVFG
jgi:F0F1-type ATP synthase assembly protein I